MRCAIRLLVIIVAAGLILGSLAMIRSQHPRGIPPAPAGEVAIAEPQTADERHAELIELLHERGRQSRVERLMAPTSRAAARRLWLLPVEWENQHGGDVQKIDNHGVRTEGDRRMGLAIWTYPEETICLTTEWTQEGNMIWYIQDYEYEPGCDGDEGR